MADLSLTNVEAKLKEMVNECGIRKREADNAIEIPDLSAAIQDFGLDVRTTARVLWLCCRPHFAFSGHVLACPVTF